MANLRHNDGRSFEITVADSLRLAGWRVEREQLLAHKKVDIVLNGERWGRTWTVAVECKDYQRPLTRETVINVWTDYEPLIRQGFVNEVLLVTSHGLAPSAVTYVNSIANLEAQQLSGLLSASIDFSNYLMSAIESFTESPDGLSHYYIPPKTSEGDDLEATVTSWIHGVSEPPGPDPDQPIAILGAYGIGKSSFSTYLSYSLAKIAQDDPQARIPILIRLGDIAGEQSLEGLLGKHFTATHDVTGYSFAAFQALNKSGRFVIIFDGFDEMKQLLSWREFRYNLKQLNRLHEGDSKLIILGRPTAFETDEEHRFALHGIKANRLGVMREPGWPDYFEIEIAQLDVPEMKVFLSRYLTYRRSPAVESETRFEQLWETVVSKQLRDIAKRPVQLRMLAEILSNSDINHDQLDLKSVYDISIMLLIDDVIKREEEKQARLAFSADERRRFLTELAFWLWRNQMLSVESELLPLELVDQFVRDNDPESVRRDLIVGSPLDRRAGEQLRFPHLSIQEFLVGEAIWEKLAEGSLDLSAANTLVTDEIAMFMSLQRSRSEIATARNLLGTLKGMVTWRVLNAVFLEEQIIESIWEQFHNVKRAERRSYKYRTPTPWELLLLAIWSVESGHKKLSLTPSDFTEMVKADAGGPKALVCFFCLLLVGSSFSWHAESAYLSLLDTVITKGGEITRISESALGRSGIKLLEGGYVGAEPTRMGQVTGRPRIGELVGRGRLAKDKGKLVILGSDAIDVRWLPEQTIQVAKRLEFMRGGRRVGLRGLRGVFAKFMPDMAFVADWVSEDSLNASVRLIDAIDLSSPAEDLMMKVNAIRYAYEKISYSYETFSGGSA